MRVLRARDQLRIIASRAHVHRQFPSSDLPRLCCPGRSATPVAVRFGVAASVFDALERRRAVRARLTVGHDLVRAAPGSVWIELLLEARVTGVARGRLNDRRRAQRLRALSSAMRRLAHAVSGDLDQGSRALRVRVAAAVDAHLFRRCVGALLVASESTVRAAGSRRSARGSSGGARRAAHAGGPATARPTARARSASARAAAAIIIVTATGHAGERDHHASKQCTLHHHRHAFKSARPCPPASAPQLRL